MSNGNLEEKFTKQLPLYFNHRISNIELLVNKSSINELVKEKLEILNFRFLVENKGITILNIKLQIVQKKLIFKTFLLICSCSSCSLKLYLYPEGGENTEVTLLNTNEHHP